MKLVLILCAALVFGCQHAENRTHKDRLVVPQLSKRYKKEHHLFLNYYFGMSVEEYEKATRQNFMSKHIFLSGEREACDLNQYGHHHTQEDIDAIGRNSLVYYEFDTGKLEFEAIVKPVFKYNRLIGIELQTLNCFNFGGHQHEFYRNKVNETRLALVDMHRQQFGQFKLTRKRHTANELAVAENAGVNLSQFDTDKYTFKQDHKVVTIEQKCCDFKPLVIYTHRAAHDLQHNYSAEAERAFERELYHYYSVESQI